MKPENILIDFYHDDDGNGVLKRLALCDFGISTTTKVEGGLTN